MTALDNALPGEPGPITVPLERFRPGIPADTWPAGLPDVGVLRRNDVFAVADAWRAGQSTARQLTLAVLLWGFGGTSYGPHRTRRILAADPEGLRLEAALAPLRDRLDVDDLRAVYVSMRRGQPQHVRGLGPAFFTKLIYFAGYRRSAGGVQPLILDKRVASRLPADAGPARRRDGGWPSSEWVTYLRWAAEQAGRATFGDEPERVEMALFSNEWTAG
ncbi:8-oxoguanine DNA glycosylase OGG fold protein [Pseudonocardia hydrocarbonoxydans]|nr:hypothetical protein [Pseudonocardia hydrocarbonoxydans]